MKSVLTAVAVLAVTTAAAGAQGPNGKGASAPSVITVRLVDKSLTSYVFEPAEITAKPGDVVRFLQTGAMPHNIEFRTVPAGVDLGSYKASEMMVQKDQVFEIKIDARFKGGKYAFVCVPHESMGMKGSLTITAAK